GEEKARELCQKAGIDLDKTLETYKAIPKNEDEIKLVEILTEEAVMKAVERHAGQIRYVYGPSGRSTLAEGKDLTQVKYIVGTGGALTRLPHRRDIMERISQYDETGMRLFPTSHAEILVDNDYIMASLGVLSKNHREGAKKLLEKSLNFRFPEKKDTIAGMMADPYEKASAAQTGSIGAGDCKGQNSGTGQGDSGGQGGYGKGTVADDAGLPAALRGVADELAEKDAKRAEMIKHIEECEAEGYDMSAYREDLGLPPAAQATSAESSAPPTSQNQQATAAQTSQHGVGDFREATGADAPDLSKMEMKNVDTCDHNCRYCSRTACPNRKRDI
ncbi:MAG: glutamate mutase L, partial [Bacillota bacterium]|nr:glutamate mutase L [Bacillota bacterium]